MTGYLSVLYSLLTIPSAVADNTLNTAHHTSYLSAIESGSFGMNDQPIMRIVVRVEDTGNSGTDDVISAWTYQNSDYDFELNTAGDNLNENNINTFWYTSTNSLDIEKVQLYNDGGDWFQYDTIAFTNFNTGQSIGLDDSAPYQAQYTADDGYSWWNYSSSGLEMYALRLVIGEQAGEADYVYARLTWDNGDETEWLRLDNPWLDDFETGDTNLFFLPIKGGLGGGSALVDLELRLLDSSAAGLIIDEVTLVREDIDDGTISLTTVLDEDEPVQLGSATCSDDYGTCDAEHSLLQHNYTFTATTSGASYADTDSPIYGRLVLTDGATTDWLRLDDPDNNDFEKNAVETFMISAPDAWLVDAEPQFLDLKTTGSDRWQSASLVLTDEDGDTVISYSGYKLDTDCDADVTDGCAAKVRISTAGTVSGL